MDMDMPMTMGTITTMMVAAIINMLTPWFNHPLAHLIRLNRQSGTWLLFWPCCWGLLLGYYMGNTSVTPLVGYLFLFLLGAWCLRSLGCIINDFWDRAIDRRVTRTAQRPLAAGTLSGLQVGLMLGGLGILGLGILVCLPLRCWALGLAALPLVVIYPLMKRCMPWPQFFLGLTFTYGLLLGYSALAWPPPPQLLFFYLSGLLWTVVYDTLYALQDREEDQQQGLHSLTLTWEGHLTRNLRLCILGQGLAWLGGGWVVFQHGAWGWLLVGLGFILFQERRLIYWMHHPDQALGEHARLGGVMTLALAGFVWLATIP